MYREIIHPRMLRLLCIAVLFSVNEVSAVDYFQGTEARKFTCSKGAELICSEDCLQVRMCVGDGAGGFDDQLMEVCDAANGLLCGSGACVPEAESDCAYHSTTLTSTSTLTTPGSYNFQCHDKGAFPDPRDCTVFYICTDDESNPLVMCCEEPWAYNPLKIDCSLPQSHRVCVEGPVPRCEDVGQEGVVPENPAIYYKCDEYLVPQMYRCHHGQEYDMEKHECAYPPQPTSTYDPTSTAAYSTSGYVEMSSTETTSGTSLIYTDSTEATTSTEAMNTEGTTSAEGTTGAEGTTSPEGTSTQGTGGTLVSDSTTVTSRTSSTIDGSSSFSNDATTTELSFTSISVDSTTAASTTTETSASTGADGSSVTTADITTDTSHVSTAGVSSDPPPDISSTPVGPVNTTPAAPIEGSLCDQPNQVLPDPHDCHSYYFCLTIWFHLTCIEGYYFDEKTGGCESGDC